MPSQIRNAIIVSDDRDVAEVFSDIIQILQIQLLAKSYDEKEAVELYRKLKPDLVILDIMISRYDEFYALEKIREINPHAKVMVVITDLLPETKKKLQKLKPTAVVYKHTNTEKILDIIRNMKSAS